MISVELVASAGLALEATLFPVSSDIPVADSDSVVETAGKGAYVAQFDTLAEGAHLVVGYDTSFSPPVAVVASYVYLDGVSLVLRTGNYADVIAAAQVEALRKIAQNKTVTAQSNGKMRVYENDDSTILVQADLFEDTAETQPYRGQGAEVRGRLE